MVFEIMMYIPIEIISDKNCIIGLWTTGTHIY